MRPPHGPSPALATFLDLEMSASLQSGAKLSPDRSEITICSGGEAFLSEKWLLILTVT